MKRIFPKTIFDFLPKTFFLKFEYQLPNSVQIINRCLQYMYRPSDRVRKKSENYAEIFGNIMRKKVTIMWKRRQIMRKFLQFNNVAPMAFSNI